MLKFMSSVLLLCVALVGTAAGGTMQLLDKIVAVVNSDIITQSQLNAGIAVMKKELQASNSPLPKPSVLRKKMLDLLIKERLQLAIAEKNQIKVTEKEVDKAIANIAKRNKLSVATFKQSLKQAGLPYGDYRHRIKKQITIGRLQQRAIGARVHVSEEDVDAFIKQYRLESSHRNAKYHLWDWVIPVSASTSSQTAKRQANQLLQQLRQGVSPKKLTSQLAKKYGEDNIGGDLGWRQAADLPELFSQTLKKMKVKEVSAPLRADNGFHILQLLAKRTHPQTLSRQAARAMAYHKSFQQELKKWLEELSASAYIKII